MVWFFQILGIVTMLAFTLLGVMYTLDKIAEHVENKMKESKGDAVNVNDNDSRTSTSIHASRSLRYRKSV
ncbi:hypothetical protein [Listeria cornellensis]|uniref:Uncharacterized protein n=1 Tax=Listeria cornellensis FSL F6-0969 TaxID=1265820 RepID=W7BRQ5_9LIST|nr:hypothetical protein [Listeria cornellensis]EUJ27360.1 hypothetical protein PCORN_13562 [Listeria cornellensis FSL F6-0969]